ncbi:MAG: di-trans,poly-cis-decaprenylcistransferase [Treponema sp.]|nr:di-trans,poly-cis-decaprenylcistransferase [Treponema sp.]
MPDENSSRSSLLSVPPHVGIVMDGNGRWAQERGQIRTQGHLEGLKAAKAMVKAASDLGIRYLTLFTFSTENWKRTADEVGFIMGLVIKYLKAEYDFARENRIRVRHAGDMTGLPEDVRKELQETCEATANFTGMQVILALNYGGRDEIIRAFRRFALRAFREPGIDAEKFLASLTETGFRECLDNPDIPDPDLIIRTAGEFRISNFLLWEAAYTEYYISEKYWPDWTKEDLEEALEVFRKRDRRFGGLKSRSGETAHE